MTPNQTLAQLVKAKYPGAYDDMPDSDLEKSVRAKFPGVYDDIPLTQASATPAQTTAQPAQGPTSTIGKMFKTGYDMMPAQTQTVLDLGIGAAKGIASTAIGAADLANRGVSALGLDKRIQPDVFNQARMTFTTPRNTTQSIGKGAEQVGEFLAPTSLLSKAKTAVTTGVKVLDWLIPAAIEGASAAGVNTVQTGSPAAGVGAGITAGVLTGAAPVAGKSLKWLGERIENSLVKATKRDIENGFRIGNVFKHQVGGSLSQTYDKTGAKLKDLGTQLKAELNRPQVGGVIPQVDVFQALTDASVELGKNQAKHMGRNTAIDTAVQKLMDDPVFQTIAQTGKVDLAVANEIKQGIGELGAWKYGLRDEESTAMEVVANAFYSKLRAAVEAAAVNPGKIKELNRQMGEVIPIRQAIIRRIPVDARQNVLNLGDLIGFGTGQWGLALANRLLKSGQTANVAHQAGTKIGNTTLPSTATQGIVGAGAQIVR